MTSPSSNPDYDDQYCEALYTRRAGRSRCSREPDTRWDTPSNASWKSDFNRDRDSKREKEESRRFSRAASDDDVTVYSMSPASIGESNGQVLPGTVPLSQNRPLPEDPNVKDVKEIIFCESCTLFPPSPNAPPPHTRERPPGCRTVFVGGLPENVTEGILGEIFNRCGPISRIRMSKKNFCHIRFETEDCVDRALYLSGYKVRMGTGSGPESSGRLHVDYAEARDDQYEFECRQRQLQRELRHREQLERNVVSPPAVVHFTESEAQSISEKLKDDSTFLMAVRILVTWLDRGDCSKRNVGVFYSMIQATNSHVRRLVNEKTRHEEELRVVKEQIHQQMQGILIQFGQIEKVFEAACRQKVWDHFTKAQRKNIDQWKKQAADIKDVQLQTALKERGEEEMEVSDSDDEAPKKKAKHDSDMDLEELDRLKEENESLKQKVEAYENELEILKADFQTDMNQKESQLQILQETLKNVQQQLLESRLKEQADEKWIADVQGDKREEGNTVDDRNKKSLGEKNEKSYKDLPPDTVILTHQEIRVIGVVSTFLHIHPWGASTDYILSYLQCMDLGMKAGDLEILLGKFPSLFVQEYSGIGASIERKWKYLGYPT
ncbi:unnamed protein product [Darwinula stevensoni]|uniref:RRM domain-containing protein n=1 Tax=Darwinula stevensoni TaxID=69355 RepID=A0A7R8ZWY8_9CRUS|nr:unnamed protein product [Darwinula stevensoni]CAG0878476.1 unnamed protein product [Darwinula stevensoni]